MARTANLPPASPSPRFQVRYLIVGFSTVYGLACLAILGAVFNIAATLDQQERDRSAFHANQALEQRLLASRQFLSSYAVWGAALEHLRGQADWQWAYEEKNVGESLYSANGYEGVFVVENDRTTYALFKGQPSQAPAYQPGRHRLPPVLEQPATRAPAARGGVASPVGCTADPWPGHALPVPPYLA